MRDKVVFAYVDIIEDPFYIQGSVAERHTTDNGAMLTYLSTNGARRCVQVQHGHARYLAERSGARSKQAGEVSRQNNAFNELDEPKLKDALMIRRPKMASPCDVRKSRL
jgi:hypothetical protein